MYLGLEFLAFLVIVITSSCVGWFYEVRLSGASIDRITQSARELPKLLKPYIFCKIIRKNIIRSIYYEDFY